jgi:prevent-host-death family protein
LLKEAKSKFTAIVGKSPDMLNLLAIGECDCCGESMASVTAFEAKAHFGQLLERVARGEEIVITRREKPVARLIPEGETSLALARSAAARLRSLRNRIAKRTSGRAKLSSADVQSAVQEGRR